MNKKHWQRIPIVTLCETHVDCVNRTAPLAPAPTEFKMIRTTNVRDGFIDVENVRYVDEPTFHRWTRRLLPRKHDIILTREAPLGEVGMLRSNDRIFLGQRLYHFRADPDKLNPHFLLYSLLGEDLQGQIRGFGSGSTVEHMRLGDIPELYINAPPIETQRKIAGILSAYDDLIENNLRRIKILEQMAQSLYREWFVHFRFPGHESATFKDSELGRIPEGWEVKKVGDAFEIMGGGTPSKAKDEYWEDGTIQWYSPRDLTADKTMFIEKSAVQTNELGLKKSAARIFPAFSVMLTSRATIGAIAINTVPSCTNQGFITCLPNADVPLYFLYQWLKDNVENFILHASGSTFKEISKGVFKGLDFIQPTADLVKRYESSVTPISEQLLNLQRRNETLHRTRDLLLPKLLVPPTSRDA